MSNATTSSGSTRISQYAAAAALFAAAVVLGIVVLGGGSSYTLHAYFTDAGGLVTGDSVDLGGVRVGSVIGLGVTRNGLADVRLSISAASVLPLHRDTRVSVRALGQAGLTNHYVALVPGPTAGPVLPSGSVLPTAQTSGLVNYDEILDSFGPRQRSNLKELIANSNQVYAGSGARYFNQMLGAFDPALVQLNGFTGQLADDRAAIADVIKTGAVAAGAIASRSPQLMSAVQNTATTLNAISSQDRALGDDFVRAPSVLALATRTLADAGTAVTALKPTLAEIPPAAGPLERLLGRLDTTLPEVTPVVVKLRNELPDLRLTLAGLNSLEPIAVRTLHSAAAALRGALPIVKVFRYYGTDLLLGVFAGVAGVASANYDKWGHYVRLEFTQPYQTSLGGPLSGLFAKPLLPDLFNLRTRLLRRCPGGNTPPAPDGSSPWVLPSSICTPSNDMPLSVDFP